MFNKYTVTGIKVRLVGGALRLNEAQAARRQHQLKPGKTKGEYLIVEPVEFKQGEAFQYDGEIPKQIADCVSDDKAVEKNTAKAKAKALKEIDNEITALEAAAKIASGELENASDDKRAKMQSDLDGIRDALEAAKVRKTELQG